MLTNQSIQLPTKEQPKERIMSDGAAYLSNHELLSLLIGHNHDDQTGKELLSVFENVRSLSQATIEELTSINGIGRGKATQLLAAFELGKRVSQYKTEEQFIIRSPEDGANYVMEEMRTLNQEHLIALFLDTKNKVMHKLTIFIGSLNASVVHPREIFREAVKRSAASLIIFHNHPSGNPAPSQEDIHVTRRIT